MTFALRARGGVGGECQIRSTSLLQSVPSARAPPPVLFAAPGTPQSGRKGEGNHPHALAHSHIHLSACVLNVSRTATDDQDARLGIATLGIVRIFRHAASPGLRWLNAARPHRFKLPRLRRAQRSRRPAPNGQIPLRFRSLSVSRGRYRATRTAHGSANPGRRHGQP